MVWMFQVPALALELQGQVPARGPASAPQKRSVPRASSRAEQQGWAERPERTWANTRREHSQELLQARHQCPASGLPQSLPATAAEAHRACLHPLKTLQALRSAGLRAGAAVHCVNTFAAADIWNVLEGARLASSLLAKMGGHSRSVRERESTSCLVRRPKFSISGLVTTTMRSITRCLS